MHTVECYSAMIENEIMLLQQHGRARERHTDRSQGRERDATRDRSRAQPKNADTSELIYRTETDSQTENKLMISEGEEGRNKLRLWD